MRKPQKTITRLRKKLNAVYETALACIEHVGSANWRSRETQAIEALERSRKTSRFVDPDSIDAED